MSLYQSLTKFFDCLGGKRKNVDKSTIRCTEESCFNSLEVPADCLDQAKTTLQQTLQRLNGGAAYTIRS